MFRVVDFALIVERAVVGVCVDNSCGTASTDVAILEATAAAATVATRIRLRIGLLADVGRCLMECAMSSLQNTWSTKFVVQRSDWPNSPLDCRMCLVMWSSLSTDWAFTGYGC